MENRDLTRNCLKGKEIELLTALRPSGILCIVDVYRELENMSQSFGGHTVHWKVVSTRIPPSEHKKLLQQYPEKGKRSKVLRALIQMHLSGKVKNLEFTITETIG